MKHEGQWRRVEHRLPSPAVRLARMTPHGGCVFRVPNPDDLLMDFAAKDELEAVHGGPDGWVAFMLLHHVAGCAPVETEEGHEGG